MIAPDDMLTIFGAIAGRNGHHARSATTYAMPDQPVPYAQLGGYLKASPAQRTAMMSSTSAPMAAPTDTAMPATPASPAAPAAPAILV